ncbi:MAG: Endoglucanase precursor [Verrucomicrobiota bacterium]
MVNYRFVAALFWLLMIATLSAATNGIGCLFSNGGIIRGPVTEKKIALVFTGHSFAEGGATILDELKRHHAHGSFFFTGDFLTNAAFAPLIRRVVSEGHYLGPHSDKHVLYADWDKPEKTLVTQKEFRRDLAANLKKISTFGVARSDVKYFLPPFEWFNADIVRWSADAGLTLVNFTPGTRSNADYMGDDDKNFVSSEKIFQSILTREQSDPHGLNGFLLLLHIGSGPARTDKFAARFGELLDALTAKGYEFVRVDELLEQRPPVFVRANQVGYGLQEPKVAVAFSHVALPESFSLVDAATLKTVFTGRGQAILNVTWGQFTNHAELDFSKVKRAGNYFIRCGDAVSWPFAIGENIYAPLPDALLEFMREQRCGYNPWLGTNCHPADGRTAYGPLTNGTPLDASGGWHDAGDLLKYLLTSGNATAQMLLAYKLNLHSTNFNDHTDALGNATTNGLPDILDEARWGLDWMLKLHPAPEQLYHQVADDRDHAGWRLPPDDPVDYGWGKGGARVVYFADGQPQGLRKYLSASTGVANLAGRYAAAMALAYQIWRDDPQRKEFAARCLQAGKEVYALGRAKPGVQQGNSCLSPYRYEETTWADDMEWGAAELFRATGEKQFLDDAKRFAALAADESWMGKEQTGHYQFYPFMNVGHFRLYDLVDDGFKKVLAGFYRSGIERCIAAGGKNPYRIGVPFIWCSANLTAALVTQCAMYERMTGDTRYREFAAAQRDWLLGRNPWGTTMFTEIGSVFPRDVHLMTTQLTKRSVRGALVDGPVYDRIFKSLKGVTIREPDPLAAFQGAAVYHDDMHDYSSNEPTMDGTASAILMFALEKTFPGTR